MAIRVDKLIGELIRAAEAQAGAGQRARVLTADHGVAPVPGSESEAQDAGRAARSGSRARRGRKGAAKAISASGQWIDDMSDGVLPEPGYRSRRTSWTSEPWRQRRGR